MTPEQANVDKYQSQGYTILENVVPESTISAIKESALMLKTYTIAKSGETSPYGSPVYWEALEMASKYDDSLYDFYTSDLMKEVVTTYLSKTPYLYNDQLVIKAPCEFFSFQEHYDNQYNDRNVRTMNASVILDDQNKHNGHLWVQDALYKVWIPLYPKAGDIVLIDGDTYHASGDNLTHSARGLYACTYASECMNNPRYYTESF